MTGSLQPPPDQIHVPKARMDYTGFLRSICQPLYSVLQKKPGPAPEPS